MIVWTVLIHDRSRPEGAVTGVYSTQKKAIDEAADQAKPNLLPQPIHGITEKGDYIADVWTYMVDEDMDIVVESHQVDS